MSTWFSPAAIGARKGLHSCGIGGSIRNRSSGDPWGDVATHAYRPPGTLLPHPRFTAVFVTVIICASPFLSKAFVYKPPQDGDRLADSFAGRAAHQKDRRKLLELRLDRRQLRQLVKPAEVRLYHHKALLPDRCLDNLSLNPVPVLGQKGFLDVRGKPRKGEGLRLGDMPAAKELEPRGAEVRKTEEPPHPHHVHADALGDLLDGPAFPDPSLDRRKLPPGVRRAKELELEKNQVEVIRVDLLGPVHHCRDLSESREHRAFDPAASVKDEALPVRRLLEHDGLYDALFLDAFHEPLAWPGRILPDDPGYVDLRRLHATLLKPASSKMSCISWMWCRTSARKFLPSLMSFR